MSIQVKTEKRTYKLENKYQNSPPGEEWQSMEHMSQVS